MRDLKVYYQDEKVINSKFDREMDKLAKKFGLRFMGCGVETATHIRDIHYEKKM